MVMGGSSDSFVMAMLKSDFRVLEWCCPGCLCVTSLFPWSSLRRCSLWTAQCPACFDTLSEESLLPKQTA